MNNVELYQSSNSAQKRDAQQCLEEYAKKIKWKDYGGTVIDIGCGDGGVTSDILKPFIPNNYKGIIGCDINMKMIRFADTHHATDFISFTVLDIESELPKNYREKFEHVFSFYVLHWIKLQEIAFSNIYNLLEKGGDCLLMFVGKSAVFDIIRKLACTPRWRLFLRDVEGFVSPYHDCQEPEKKVKTMLTSVGFTNVEVNCVKKMFVYTGVEVFKNAMKAVTPFIIPLDMQEDFWNDYIKVVHDMQLVNYSNFNEFNVKIKYNLIIVYAKK